jgi:LAO/AO transport system kinase
VGGFLGSDNLGELLKRVKNGDTGGLASLLTWSEQAGPRAVYECTELFKDIKPAFKIGITGPPGAGKSTLIGRLISEYRKKNMRVGVLAVDPSSPFSKGAILGDRIRYSEHFTDPKVFIRSIGTRGSLGGLSASAYLMLHAFDYAGFDVVIVETVGVGQTELEIINVADITTVVLVPESGDSIQAMKAGLTEIGDLFVVNKADRPGAEALKRELEAEFMDSPKPPQCLLVTATEGRGVSELAELILSMRPAAGSVRTPEQLRNEAKALLRQAHEETVNEKVRNIETRADLLAALRG